MVPLFLHKISETCLQGITSSKLYSNSFIIYDFVYNKKKLTLIRLISLLLLVYRLCITFFFKALVRLVAWNNH